MGFLEDGTVYNPLLTVPLQQTEPMSPEWRLLKGAFERGFRYTTVVVHSLWGVPLVNEDRSSSAVGESE